jgi:signal transduction protein with GAF and PtsI domain
MPESKGSGGSIGPSPDDLPAGMLEDALKLAALASAIRSPVPYSRLLELVVETAARAIQAQAASLFLIDEQSQELVFEVALGEKAEAVKAFRVPLGQGIVGLVAMTGQSMSVADARQDPRHHSEISKQVGYVPTSILCVPLFYGDQVIGALELLDKTGGEAFTPGDAELLGLFANQAAVGIEEARQHQQLASLAEATILGKGTPATGTASSGGPGGEEAGLEALELARLVYEIAQHGHPERNACRKLLEGFAQYLRTRHPLPGAGP